MFNRVLLEGRFVKNPEEFLFGSGNGCRFVLANNTGSKEKAETSFIRCTAFGKTADFIMKYFIKGDPIFVEGKLKTDTYAGKDGEKRNSFSVIIQSVHLISAKKQRGNSSYAEKDKNIENVPDFMDDDELPF